MFIPCSAKSTPPALIRDILRCQHRIKTAAGARLCARTTQPFTGCKRTLADKSPFSMTGLRRQHTMTALCTHFLVCTETVFEDENTFHSGSSACLSDILSGVFLSCFVTAFIASSVAKGFAALIFLCFVI